MSNFIRLSGWARGGPPREVSMRLRLAIPAPEPRGGAEFRWLAAGLLVQGRRAPTPGAAGLLVGLLASLVALAGCAPARVMPVPGSGAAATAPAAPEAGAAAAASVPSA